MPPDYHPSPALVISFQGTPHLLLFGALKRYRERTELVIKAKSKHQSFVPSPAVPLSPRQQTQARALREEIAALRKDAEEAKEQAHRPQNEQEEEEQVQRHQVQAEEDEEDAPVQVEKPQQEPPLSLPEVVDDSATWRRRYEHLAGLLAEQTKGSSEKVSTGDRRERSVGASSTAVIMPFWKQT